MLASVTEFSQMFQMFDDDLDVPSLSTQFAFDHLRQNSEEKSTAAKSSSSFGHGREGNELDSFEVVFRLK